MRPPPPPTCAHTVHRAIAVLMVTAANLHTHTHACTHARAHTHTQSPSGNCSAHGNSDILVFLCQFPSLWIKLVLAISTAIDLAALQACGSLVILSFQNLFLQLKDLIVLFG
jgi:hypothetical protein